MSEEKKNDLNENNSSNINNDLSKSNEEMLSNNNNNNNDNDNNNNNNNNNNNINSLNNKNTSFNTSNSKSEKKKEEKLKQSKKFDILIINTELNKLKENEFYTDKNNNKFMYNNKAVNSEKYYASITLNEGLSEFKYIGGLGIFDTNLNQQGFGYIEYEKDKYIGNWEKDTKNGLGIYVYEKNENEKNEKNEQNINNLSNSDKNDYKEEIYIGNWENDLKKGKGIYMFKKHKEEDITKGDYDFLIGNFIDDKFHFGYIISKKDDDKIIYKGKINENGEKDDEESFYFENFNNNNESDININNKSFDDENDKEKKGFCGEFKNNNMNKGRIIIYGENDEINKSYYFEKIINVENNIDNNNNNIDNNNNNNLEMDLNKNSEFENNEKDDYNFDIEKEVDKNKKINEENKFIINHNLNEDDIILKTYQFYIDIFKDLNFETIKDKKKFFEEKINEIMEITNFDLNK